MHSTDLSMDQYVALGKLNSIAVGSGPAPPISLAGAFPRIFPEARAVFGEVFRPKVLPEHLAGDYLSIAISFNTLVSLECQDLFEALANDEIKRAERIRSRLSKVGVTIDTVQRTWHYTAEQEEVPQSAAYEPVSIPEMSNSIPVQ
ncbi:MAG: hypothetical protein FWG25_10825 [Promicromonosporaceae bacterium]|nr:hypothetical protein [Promicromonosporaceae bacterium]